MRERSYGTGDVVVHVIEATALLSRAPALTDCLAAEEQTRLNRYGNAAARDMFIAARGGLRLLLARLLNTGAGAIRIATHEHGKPYLPDYPDLHFNISHSRTLALIAIASHPVGVDIEYLRRPVDFAAVLRRFFSSDERRDWQNHATPTPAEAFFRGWTRKEAILKATGEGIAGLGHTVVSFKPDEPRALLSRLQDPAEAQKWLFKDFCPATDYQAAVALQAPALNLSIEAFSLHNC